MLIEMKILNLYAGIGGNRKLWGNEHEITAVELREDIAAVYRDHFPNDNIVIADAHKYLLLHYNEYDFVWSSPPCQKNSRSRFWRHSTLSEQSYPDLRLYEEQIFLKHYFKGKWVIENVKPYYDVLIPASIEIGRHLFWSNVTITKFEFVQVDVTNESSYDFKIAHGFDLSKYKLNSRKDQIYRNCVHPETGLHILNCAMNIITKKKASQGEFIL